ncbi:MAG: homoserine kinase [Ignavibacteriaceae bacterium]|nr:homoserine kinase [Ignavibacteriaceae bacterium]
MEKSIKVFAPASVTNVSCGFDVFGFALTEPGDELVLRIKNRKGLHISSITGDNGALPTTPEQNTAGKALISMMNELDFKMGIEIDIHKKMPLGSGLGSSAASAVAAVFALNEILEKPFTKKELIKYAIEGEKLTSGGAPHADNVTASMLGGFTAVKSILPLDVFKIPTTLKLFAAVVHPQIEIKTADARKSLKKEVLLKNAVTHWANTAAFVYALMTGDVKLLSRSIDDVIIEPQRAGLIPKFFEAKEAALRGGAIGSGISGSGPSIFSLFDDFNTAHQIGSELKKIYEQINLRCDLYISAVNYDGAKVLG